MLQYLKNEANLTHTENGAVTYQSTQSECLDLFATIGALRRESDEEITNRFLRAYAENADLAMKTLFFARDIRGGIGERRVFRTILRWLAHNEPQSVEKNIPYIAEYWPTFGVCGTGLSMKEFGNGSMGTYDGGAIWNFISYPASKGNFVATTQGVNSWWSRYGETAMEIITQVICTDTIVD